MLSIFRFTAYYNNFIKLVLAPIKIKYQWNGWVRERGDDVSDVRQMPSWDPAKTCPMWTSSLWPVGPTEIPCRDGLVVSVSAFHTVSCGFASWPGHIKSHKNLHCTHVLGWEFDTVDRVYSVWTCLWGHALKISPGINRKRMGVVSRSRISIKCFMAFSAL